MAAHSTPITSYLSLGSNIGDRLENLRAAMQRFCEEGIALQRTSSIYETEPVDHTGQGWFLNCIVVVSTTLEPLAFLRHLQRIERDLGRERVISKGPRTIDIDVLLYDEMVMHSDELTIPHPRMVHRRFVLEPLAEVAPSLRIPGTSKTVAAALHELRDPAQVRLLIKTLCA